MQKGFGDELGTIVGVDTDLAVTGSKTWGLTGAIQLKAGLKLRGSYLPIDFDGDTEVPLTFEFGGETFYYGTRVVTSIKGYYYTGSFEWDFIRRPSGYVGILLGANVVDGDFLLVAPDEGIRQVEGGVLPIPVLGLTGRGYVGKVSLEGTLAGLTIGDRGNTYDLALAARYHPIERVAVGLGYRKVSVTGKDERDSLTFRMSGWTLGLELSL